MQQEYGFGYAPEYKLSNLTSGTRKLISDYRYAGSIENHGTLVSPDFKSFFKRYKNALKRELGEGFRLVNSLCGHYNGSFVFENVDSGKLLYISLGDVRAQFPVPRIKVDFTDNQAFTSIMIRETFNEDGTGRSGRNIWVSIFDLRHKAYELTA